MYTAKWAWKQLENKSNTVSVSDNFAESAFLNYMSIGAHSSVARWHWIAKKKKKKGGKIELLPTNHSSNLENHFQSIKYYILFYISEIWLGLAVKLILLFPNPKPNVYRSQPYTEVEL